MQQTDLCGQARLTAYSAPSADAWLRATPSHNQDTLLSNAAFRDVLSMRLGVKIFDDGMACSFPRKTRGVLVFLPVFILFGVGCDFAI